MRTDKKSDFEWSFRCKICVLPFESGNDEARSLVLNS